MASIFKRKGRVALSSIALLSSCSDPKPTDGVPVSAAAAAAAAFSCEKAPLYGTERECRPPPVIRHDQSLFYAQPRAFCSFAERLIGNEPGWVCYASEVECNASRKHWRERYQSSVGNCIEMTANDPSLKADAEKRYEREKTYPENIGKGADK